MGKMIEPGTECGSTIQSRSRRRRAILWAALTVTLALAATFAWWAKGRGYKTWVLGQLFPESRWALKKPWVTEVRPGNRQGGVLPDSFIAADVALPNPGKVIDASTLEGGVQLTRGNAREKVPCIVNTSGGGDAIVLKPLQPLEVNALYVFEVLPHLRDTAGASFQPFKSSFSTAAGTSYSEFPAAAEKVSLPTTHDHMFTGLTVGPDRRLYGCTVDGRVIRYPILPDGTLGAGETIDAILRANQGPRLVTGIAFDPCSTPQNPVAWVSHSYFPFDLDGPQGPRDSRDSSGGGDVNVRPKKKKDVPEWTGKISRLTGANLDQYEDWVVGLPRARHDHTTNQVEVGPDGCLYFSQASNTAMGAPDHEWGYRPERLLTAAVLRVDPKLIASRPVDVRTDNAGSYDPFAPGAPVTIHASGIRSGYDVLWHRNGRMYVPVNGSARGGNAPATSGASAARRMDAQRGPYAGPAVPGLEALPTQNDYLLNIEPGGYYGHPNPTRAEFVLNGGNPSAAADPCEVPEYPVGTPPDRNWRLPSYDFGKNLSPCGLIEYQGDAFPALKGCILIARYSGGKDVYALRVAPDGAVTEFISNLDGFTFFHDPVDLAEDPATGYLYVSEFGGRRITLLRPTAENLSRKAIAGPASAPGAKPAATQLAAP